MACEMLLVEQKMPVRGYAGGSGNLGQDPSQPVRAVADPRLGVLCDRRTDAFSPVIPRALCMSERGFGAARII